MPGLSLFLLYACANITIHACTLWPTLKIHRIQMDRLSLCADMCLHRRGFTYKHQSSTDHISTRKDCIYTISALYCDFRATALSTFYTQT